MNDIFLSYAKEDKNFAKELAISLENKGFDVWWDIEILAGKPFDTVIEKAIDNSKCVIVLWSKSSVDSEWVRVEAAEGKKRNILIPVRIENVEVPLAFRRRHYIDLMDWFSHESDSEFNKLINDINSVLNNNGGTEMHNEPSGTGQKPKRFNIKKYILPIILFAAIIISGISWWNNKKNEDHSIERTTERKILNPDRNDYQEESTVDISPRVIAVLSNQIGVSESELTSNLRFEEDLGRDTLDMLEIFAALEIEFDITIPENQLIRIKTVGDAVRFVEQATSN